MKIVIIGPPGVGKGTCAKHLSERYNIPHISTGSMMRTEIALGTPIGLLVKNYVEKGLLVPDDIIIPIVINRLRTPECTRGFILDGFPRTLRQAIELDKEIGVDIVFLLEAPLDILIERSTGRYICPNCGAIYHIKWRPPRNDFVCDNCGSRIGRRDDDTPEVVIQRYKIYRETFEPIIKYYKGRNILVSIDASRSTTEIVVDMEKELEKLSISTIQTRNKSS